MTESEQETGWNCTIIHKILTTFHFRLSCVNGNAWHDSPKSLCQIDRIGKSFSKTLHEAGILTLQELSASDARRIEHLLGRHAPFGNEIKESINVQIPLTFLNVEAKPEMISIELGLKNQGYSSSSSKYAHLLVLEYQAGEANLLQYRKFEYKYCIRISLTFLV